MPSGRGPSRQAPGHTHIHTHAAGQTDGQRQRRAPAGLTAGRRVRRVSGRRREAATSHGAVGRAASRAGSGESRRPFPANSAAGPAPLPRCLWVCPSVPRCPGLRAVPRRSPPAAQLSALPRAAPSAPPQLQHRRAPGRGSERGGPGTHGAGSPRPRRLLSAAPTVLSLSLGAVPRPALRSLARCARLRPRDPRSRPARALPPPPPPAPSALGLSQSLLPAWVSPTLPAGPCLRLRRPPGLSAAFLCLCPLSPERLCLAPGPCLCLSLSLPPTLGAAPAVSDPGPRLCRVPGSPGSPSSRRPRRAENSQLAARRPALRDFRPSSHVTRAPLRRPRPPTPAPEPRAARGTRPRPVPSA